ncbi:MAG: GtrA family protein [Pseudomonadota bacterium]
MHNDTPIAARANFSLRSALTFLVVGGFTTGMQYAVMALLIYFAGMSIVLASAIGFIVSAIVNYFLNARLTFRSKKAHGNTMPRFVATAGIGLLLNSLVLAGLTSVGIHVALAQVIATICVLIWNYTINAIWTFKH